MENDILNFESFELPFFKDAKNQRPTDVSNDAIDGEEDMYLIKANMKSRIPKSAIYLGAVETELEHATTTWITRDEYYIYPLHDDEYNWAVFRISWDDNWGRWVWSPDGRLKGRDKNFKEAARLILNALWKQWELDLNDSENESYLNLLEQIK